MKENSLENEKIIEIRDPNAVRIPQKVLTKLDILKKTSFGTGLREALNNIVSGGMGALILVHNPNAINVFQGGFKVNCKFTSKRLVELAKMDCAIVLSEDFKKILYANTLLIPNSSLSTMETGSRHQAAERAAKQINGLVIAISQRMGKITIFYRNSKYILQNTEDLLRRATETLQILEKQRDVFDELTTNLNILEVTDLVSVGDVCNLLQRLGMIKKMAEIINEYIIGLGKDGLIVRMRMREITKGIDKNKDFMAKDYGLKDSRIKPFFDNLNFEELLDTENIARNLFEELLDKEVFTKGYRILSKSDLDKDSIEILIKNFKNLNNIFSASKQDLVNIFGEKAEDFIKNLNNLREQIMIGKKI